MKDTPPFKQTTKSEVNSHTLPSWLEVATSSSQVVRSLKTSLIVGTLLTLINQGMMNTLTLELDWLKVTLTYLVPYMVSTYAGTNATLEFKAKLPLP